MKQLIFLIVLLCAMFTYAQEDTSFAQKIKVLEEIEISTEAKIIFDQPNIYVLDFYIDSNGHYLLLKERSSYYLALLDDNFTIASSISLLTKPKALFRNCLNTLYIYSEDSLHAIAETASHISISHVYSSAFYFDYFADCQLSTKKHLIKKSLSHSNQKVDFSAVDRSDFSSRSFYTASDSIELIVADDWEQIIRRDNFNPTSQMGEIGLNSLHEGRRKFQRLMFYMNVISKEDYNPIFIKDSSIQLFDHYSDSVIIFNAKIFEKEQSFPIAHQNIRGWQKQIFLDQITGKYYTLFRSSGDLYIAELSLQDYSIKRSKRVRSSILTRRFMVHDGFLYYDSKETYESYFNGLNRQRL